METAVAFRAAALAGFALTALLSVSDNTLQRKSLYSGRTDAEMAERHRIRRELFPDILFRTQA